ncbi:hypothetical protein ABTA64_19450, partial [Acinetobacter baumannii]
NYRENIKSNPLVRVQKKCKPLMRTPGAISKNSSSKGASYLYSKFCGSFSGLKMSFSCTK